MDQGQLSHRVKLIRTVDRLVEPEPVDEVTFHLKRINVRKWLLSPGKTKILVSGQNIYFNFNMFVHLVRISHMVTPHPQTSVLGA